MKILVGAILFLASVIPASAQSASAFVKGDGDNCWLDVREVVHRRAHDVTENNDLQTLRAGNFATMSGDVYRTIQALTEKDKKGVPGCRIYVSIEGGGSLGAAGLAVNDFSDNQKLANYIAADISAMQKAREKKEKDKDKKPASQ